MLRFIQRLVTQEDWEVYALFAEDDPSDDDIAQFIRDKFARF